MILGAYVVTACPYCGHLGKSITMQSGNNFGAMIWSDGYIYAQMMIFEKELVACQNCSGIYWYEDAKRVGSYDPYEDDFLKPNRAFEASPPVAAPDLEGYYLALEKGLGDTIEREITIRILAWWEVNHPARKYDRFTEVKMPKFRLKDKNSLKRMLKILDPSYNRERYMMAEIYREMGQFEKSMELLVDFDFGEMQWMADMILSLAKDGDSLVALLTPSK